MTEFRVPQQRNDLNLRLMCKFCRDQVPNLIEDYKAGDLICGNCGLVVGSRIIDTRSEWRTFANSDESNGDPSRVGAVQNPLLGPGMIDSTVISGLDRGSGLSRELGRTHNKIAHDRNVQNLLDAFKSLQHMADMISLPRIVTDTVKRYYKMVQDGNIARGKSQDAIKAACIYIACKEHNSARTFKEICNLTKVSKKDLGRCFKQIKHLLTTPEDGEVSYESHVYRVASQLDMNQMIISPTLKLTKKVKDLGILDGKSPITVVAACLYFVSCLSQSPTSAKQIAEAALCTESTLKNAYRILYEHSEELVDGLGLLSVENLPP